MGEGPYRKGKEVRVEDKQIIDLYWARRNCYIRNCEEVREVLPFYRI